MNKKLIVICGPTATGKTALALKLCKSFNGEIISADSRQLYQELDIGSGRGLPNKGGVGVVDDTWVENGIPIHLYNVLKPSEQITVIKYVKLAQKKLEDLWQRGKIPFLAGGTGFYINAVLGDIEIEQIPANEALRKELAEQSLEQLINKLKTLDPKVAKTIDMKNKRRLIRSIERATYKRTHKANKIKQPINLEPLIIGLTAPKGVLYKKIEGRTEQMLKQGLIDEVKLLIMKYGPEAPALDAIGYRQFVPYLLGEEPLEKSVEEKNNAEHQYAKRQLTWFKRDKRIKWFDISTSNFDQQIAKLVRSYLELRS